MVVRWGDGKRVLSMMRSSSLACGLSGCVIAMAGSAQAQIIVSSGLVSYAKEAGGSITDIQPPIETIPLQPFSATMASTAASVETWNLTNVEEPRIISGPSAGVSQTESVQPAVESKERYRSFGDRARTVKWEALGFAAYITATNIKGVINNSQTFHFESEKWFSKSSGSLGTDKLAHVYNTYLMAEILHARMVRKTGGGHGEPLTAAVLASGLSVYSELFDAHHKGSGFSLEDIFCNTLGAGFSVLRNTSPGFKEKVDFRMVFLPNSDIFNWPPKSPKARKFVLALTLAGFKEFENSPLRFVELHAGYYAKGYRAGERAAGVPLERRPYVGIGLNIKELFFHSPRSKVARAASSVLDYVQFPYTALTTD